ncbi:D-serine ammonia-lyase [Caulobacter sp. KR2-114]|uniref:D-serine ammonia-lyase n=1 Tax=Caulobacter sp. KR2-114 TaxID=3400912 RepID=UPI003C11858E
MDGGVPGVADGEAEAVLGALRRGEPALWRRPGPARLEADRAPLDGGEAADAQDRFTRFAPALARLFPADGWDGQVRSALSPAPDGWDLWLKGDHALPIAGSVKARGGVYEVLCHVESLAGAAGVWAPGEPMLRLLEPAAVAALSRHWLAVASTGNLGFAVGVAARAFGLRAEVHMSREAKAWKKARLRAIGVEVVEHAGDYGLAVARARERAKTEGAYFVDDEASRRLFVGYAAAAAELAGQLRERRLEIGPKRPLVVWLPCGVGGAPGGIAAGLKRIYGADVRVVFVEPVASACVLAALAVGGGRPVSVYDLGLGNDTLADGLAVASASPLALDAIGRNIDAVAAVSDAAMLRWIARAWREAGLRLEPSAAAALAAAELTRARAPDLVPEGAVQVAWLTGGSLLPDDEFERLLAQAHALPPA